jgi:hypothetical protein
MPQQAKQLKTPAACTASEDFSSLVHYALWQPPHQQLR